MKKENAKSTIAKNKKRTRVLCYISLFVLIILLLLPPAFRMFIKEKTEEEKPADVIMVLSCDNLEESISSTFLNDKPQNIMYQVKGNLTVTQVPDEEDTMENDKNSVLKTDTMDNQKTETNEITNDASQNTNNKTSKDYSDVSIYETLRPYSNITYDEEAGVTIVRTSVSDLESLSNYEELFGNINNQENFFRSRGFTCTTTTS